MKRMLLVETASPKRVRKKADELIAAGLCSASDLTILCRDDPSSIREMSAVDGVRLIPLQASHRGRILQELGQEKFEVVGAFWTGDRRYLGMKLAAMRIPAQSHQIDIGDGHVFRLSLGTFLWFLRTRIKYRRPSDYAAFMPSPPARGDLKDRRSAYRAGRAGEEILIVQSADPPAVLRALQRLKERPVFREAHYTLFCRNTGEIVDNFRNHPMLHRIITHNETRGALGHVAALRRRHFDAVVLFFTGDPSYWKIKCLPFLLGTRHKLVFNENNDCFFFSWSAWYSHISRRFAENIEPDNAPGVFPRAHPRAMMGVKLVLLPFRFLWLLLVWLWLRSSGLRSSG